jgi:hypothetical protein
VRARGASAALIVLCLLNATARRSLENQILRDGERDMFIKQTYSVLRHDVAQPDDPADSTAPDSTPGADAAKRKGKKKQRKWHLSAPAQSLSL